MDIDPLPAIEATHQLLLAISPEIADPAFDLGGILALAIALVCLLLSGFISASEISLFSLTQSQLEKLDENSQGETVRQLLSNPERLLATILIANNLVNVTIVVLCNFALGPVFSGMNAVLSFVLQSVILTFLILLFGEILPKLYSSNYPEKWAVFAAPGLKFISTILSPASKFMVGSTSIVNRVVTKKAQNITADDLSQALEITSGASKSDKEILEGILRYGETQASEIMTPRVDILDLEMKMKFDEVMKAVIDSGYARIPVYEDNEDNIKGILFSRDLLPYIGKVDNDFDWTTLLREPYYVPESRMIDDLLEDFRKRKQHIAIVVDEFGCTQGIVTLEDVLEEIVGDIDDEYDTPDSTFKRLRDNIFEFEGRTPLTDFFRVTEINEDKYADVTEDAETLAGMLLTIKGDFPRVRETLRSGQCEFTILEITDHRIVNVRVKVMPEE